MYIWYVTNQSRGTQSQQLYECFSKFIESYVITLYSVTLVDEPPKPAIIRLGSSVHILSSGIFGWDHSLHVDPYELYYLESTFLAIIEISPIWTAKMPRSWKGNCCTNGYIQLSSFFKLPQAGLTRLSSLKERCWMHHVEWTIKFKGYAEIPHYQVVQVGFQQRKLPEVGIRWIPSERSTSRRYWKDREEIFQASEPCIWKNHLPAWDCPSTLDFKGVNGVSTDAWVRVTLIYHHVAYTHCRHCHRSPSINVKLLVPQRHVHCSAAVETASPADGHVGSSKEP